MKWMIERTLMNADRVNQIAEKIIGAAFKVANELGIGFLEKVYENALAHELRKVGLHVEQQRPVDVYYDGVVVGVYVGDDCGELGSSRTQSGQSDR